MTKGRYRKRGDMSKVRSLKAHSKDRSTRRYGLTLTNEDLRLLVRKIQCGKGEFVEKQSNRITRWKIEHRDRMWDLIYDKERHRIVTCLSTAEAH